MSLACARRILGFGSAVFGGSVTGMLLDPFSRFILMRYGGAASLPVYDIAFRGSRQVRALAAEALRAMVPEVSRLCASGEAEGIRRAKRINTRALQLVILFLGPVFLA